MGTTVCMCVPLPKKEASLRCEYQEFFVDLPLAAAYSSSVSNLEDKSSWECLHVVLMDASVLTLVLRQVTSP